MEDFMRDEFDRLSLHLSRSEPGTDDYAKALELLKKFGEITVKKNRKIDNFLSNPALIGVIGNLMGIFLILNYERAEIITSRAINFIRPK